MSGSVKYAGFADIQAKDNKVIVIAPGLRVDQVCNPGEVWQIVFAPKNDGPRLHVRALPMTAPKREAKPAVKPSVHFKVDEKQAAAYIGDGDGAVLDKRAGHMRVSVEAEARIFFEKVVQVPEPLTAPELDKPESPA